MTPVNFASLTDSFIVLLSKLYWNFDLERKHNRQKTSLRAQKVSRTFKKQAPRWRSCWRCSSNLMRCFLCLQGILRCWIKRILVLNTITEKFKHLSNTNNIIITSQLMFEWMFCRVQRKLVLQLVIQASLALAHMCTRPRVILTSPKISYMSRIEYKSSIIWISPQKLHLPVGQVENRILKPDSKIH